MPKTNNNIIKIIINADDLGISPKVNQAISEALENKVITSSTILANSEYLDDVKFITMQHPWASFGIHLNITEGRSLSNHHIFKERGLINDKGFFNKPNCKKLEYSYIDSALKEAIKTEWALQIQRLKYEGFSLSHVDGHHHCHTWYGLGSILTELCEEYGFNKVRNKHKAFNLNDRQRLTDHIAKVLFLMGYNVCDKRKKGPLNKIQETIASYECVHAYMKQIEGLTTTDIFGDYDMIRDYNGNAHTIELMCHPGHPKLEEQTQRLMKDVYKLKDTYNLVSYNDL